MRKLVIEIKLKSDTLRNKKILVIFTLYFLQPLILNWNRNQIGKI